MGKLKMGWHQVRDIVREDLKKRESRRSWRRVRNLAIDEIAVRKGHRYMTVVVDLDTGMVLDLVNGRSVEDLEPVFRRLRRARAKLKAIAVDMSPAYRRAIQEYALEAVIVHDPFHVVQAANKALDDVRKGEQARLEREGSKVVKGNRFLLLRGLEIVLKDKRWVGRLKEMFAQNQNLYKAYLLKEDLRLLWSHPNKTEAAQFLSVWIKEAKELGLLPLRKLAKTIAKHSKDILNWYDHRITTGPLEGLNNKIKVLKRRAYGYRDQSFFRLLVLFCHNRRFRLSGT